ncbi:MAG: flotillin family protein, partial [Clostridia bacterium]|nr:flotillin family protein [Clostridia bacterium]
INVNVTDINDESGYIAALGKEAAAKAINDAKVSVAEADRNGAIGAANAEKEQRISVSRFNSEAIKGENLAKVEVAESDATRREREAEALKRATAAENIQTAKALEESYAAQEAAEQARANLEKAKLEADVLVKAEIRKKEIELQAEAQAEETRRHAKGEADAIIMKMEAQAQGMREMMTKQAEGFAEIVKAAGGASDDAVRMMIADKLEELTKIQVEAISNLKIDKITVWDSGNGNGEKGSTANFVSGLMKSVPPLQEIFDMAGMKLPEYLGKQTADTPETEKGE